MAAVYRHMSGGQFSRPAGDPDGHRRRPPTRRPALAQPGELVRARPRPEGAGPGHRRRRPGDAGPCLGGPRSGDHLRARAGCTTWRTSWARTGTATSAAPPCAVPGRDATIVTYGGSLPKALQAAADLAALGIDAEVVDLRVLRPLDREAIAVLGSADAPRRRGGRGLEDAEAWPARWSPGWPRSASTTWTHRPAGCAAPRCRSRTPGTSKRRPCRSRTTIVAAVREVRQCVSSRCRRWAPTWTRAS